jgi:NADH-quinone oxidoreductase subunit G
VTTIYIDNQPYLANPRENLLQHCLSFGFNLPYFCWHPALGSVGACRQCAIKQFANEQDTRGRIVMACMTPVADGARISIHDPEAEEFRAHVIEWLMVNHPHDCPVCDAGGECHLQDMTLLSGHTKRRYRGVKRTFRNQDLGPLVSHEMNRCIQCYRCVRFYRDYAGGHDLDVLRLRDQTYFGRHADGVLESEFAGNLVEVCPTGVFTDKPLRWRYTRKWDLQNAPSICVHCSVGCNTFPGERYGELRRVQSRYNSQVNGYFLCDRGRYGYGFVNSELRVREPLSRATRDVSLKGVSKQQALSHVAELLSGHGRVIGIGSPRASLEANFALRTLVGRKRFHLGMSDEEQRLVNLILDILRNGPASTPSLRDVELSDAVLILGEDVINTAPMLGLSLRQSVRRAPMAIAKKLGIPEWNDVAVREAVHGQHGPMFIATVTETKLDDIATETFRGAPDDIARLGFAVANMLDSAAPRVEGLPDATRALAGKIAQALLAAERPLVVSGANCGHADAIQAAANVAWALCGKGRKAQLSFGLPECNSLGVAMMGGESLTDAFDAVRNGAVDALVILENDLYRRADATAVDGLLNAAKHVIVIDHLMHATASKADVVFPAGSFAEADGTLVNFEGRAQRFFQVFVPKGEIQESWRWVQDINVATSGGKHAAWVNLDGIIAACAAAIPALRPIVNAAPLSRFRLAGEKIPRETHRYSGRTAMLANVNVHEARPPEDRDSPLAFSMEGYPLQPPPSLITFFWAPKWNSGESVHKFQEEVGGPLRGGDPGVRLIEPRQDAKAAYLGAAPAAFERRVDEWLVAPLHHIFGGEEQSALSPPVAALTPGPYLALNPDDAAGLGLGSDESVHLRLKEAAYRLPVKLKAELQRGVAGFPVGLPGMAFVKLPDWGEIWKSG